MSQLNIADLPANEQMVLNGLEKSKVDLLQEIHKLQGTLTLVNDELAAINVIEE